MAVELAVHSNCRKGPGARFREHRSVVQQPHVAVLKFVARYDRTLGHKGIVLSIIPPSALWFIASVLYKDTQYVETAISFRKLYVYIYIYTPPRTLI